MPQLTATNITVLQNYSANGQRERYWSYLSALGDPYAKRALEVVRNDGPFGQLANTHAAAFVPDARKAEFTEAKWNDFGGKLMAADLDARKAVFVTGLGDRGLTLAGKTIRDYHAAEFERVGLLKDAWTMEPYLGKLFDSGNPAKIAEGNALWKDAISGPLGYLTVAAKSPFLAIDNNGLSSGLTTTGSNLFLATQYDQRSALQNPSFIRGWSYDAATSTWARNTGPSGAIVGVLIAPTAAEKLLLDADRQYRLDRLGDLGRFQRDPQDTLTPTNPRSLASLGADPLNPDAHDLAVALGDAASGDYWSTQAGSGTGTAGTVPPNVVANIEAALAGQDLGNIGAVTAPQTYKVGGITYVDFGNGNQIAIDLTGRVASTKAEVSASGLAQTTHTGFDQSKEIYGVNADGTRTVLSLDSAGVITGSASASVSEARVTEYSSPGVVASTIAYAPDGSGGTNRTIATTVNGQPVEITQHASAADLANGEQRGDYETTAVEINGAPAENNNLIANVIDQNYPSAKDIILARGTGEFTHIVEAGDPANPDGTTPSLATLTGRPDWWNSPALASPELKAYVGDLAGVLTVLRARTPLAIATTIAGIASHKLNDPALSSVALGLGLLSNFKGLDDAFNTGSLGRVLANGGGAVRDALTIYSISLEQQIIAKFSSVAAARFAIDAGDEIAGQLIGTFDGVSALLDGLAQNLPYLNIAIKIWEGDVEGAASAAILAYFAKTDPWTAVILIAIDLLYSMFKPVRQFEAEGRYVGGTNGEITVQVDNFNGGAHADFVDRMNLFLDETRKQATEIGKLNGQPMGVIAERLPTIEFKQDVMFLRFNDPLTGQSFVRTFDLNGKYLAPGFVELVLDSDQKSILVSPWGDNPDNHFANRSADPRDINPGNQVAQSKLFFDHIAHQYSDAVTKSGAIAPAWEVETVNLQRLSGYQKAGQTTEAIAYENGTSHNLYYGAPGDARPGNAGFRNETSQQTATVIALDLNGDGVITVTKKATGNGVLFDVDNDGFAEETDWIGPRDGILVLDRTSSGEAADGQINRGVDLFNDTWVDGTRRGLSVLNEINDTGSSYYGATINAQDPVFSAGELGAAGNTAAAELYNSVQAADSLLQTVGTAIAMRGAVGRMGEAKTLNTTNNIAYYISRTWEKDIFYSQVLMAANDLAWEMAA